MQPTPDSKHAATEMSPPAGSKPQKEDLFERCKRTFDDYNFIDMYGFEAFAALAAQDRESRVALYDHKYAQIHNFEGELRHPIDVTYLQKHLLDSLEPVTLVIEDVDQRWFRALDTLCDIDPDFVQAYAFWKASNNFPEDGDNHVEGRWYVTQVYLDLHASHWRNLERRSGAGGPSLRAWWEENRRCDVGQNYEKLSSTMACYCVSERARVLFFESSPELPQGEVPFTKKSSGADSHEQSLLPPVLLYGLSGRYHRPGSMVFDYFSSCACLFSGAIDGCGELKSYLDFTIPPGTNATATTWQGLHHLSPSLLLWPLTASAWSANLTYLSNNLVDRRSEALSNPGMETYLPLIKLRRTITDARQRLIEAKEAARVLLRAFETGPCQRPARAGIQLSTTAFTHLLEEVNKLDRELNDEIHLIIGAVTVQDSAFMKEQTVRMEQQAERATLLTFLAAIYLPLTLVTGIFGMNIKDIDQGAPTFRACLAALGIAAACTILFVLCYRYRKSWQRLLSRRKDQADEEAFKAA